jgi:nitrogen regulatory protein PII
MKLVTVVAESAIERRVAADLLALGATGVTVTDARGEGTRRLGRSEFPGANVRVEAVVPPPVAARIVEHLAERYFADYALIAYVSDVTVVRSAKYDAAGRAGPDGEALGVDQ